MTYAGYVLRHLTARPLRATLTAGAFAFSIGLLGFLWLLSAALEKEWSPFMAQRVIVLSDRPARIVAEIRNPAPYPRHRGDPALAALRHQALGHLGLDGSW